MEISDGSHQLEEEVLTTGLFARPQYDVVAY
ncbi:hypothetical protein N007_12315 [Alicyclobacillus acidoterrestris ATCC 49025]|nr:hypothetical protein N007_12315 [Alicyclobacillus acidoterrestris ATCC 49025]